MHSQIICKQYFIAAPDLNWTIAAIPTFHWPLYACANKAIITETYYKKKITNLAMSERFELSNRLQTGYFLSREAPSATRPTHLKHLELYRRFSWITIAIHYYSPINLKNGDPSGNRTPDNILRRDVLYPAELTGHI